MLEKASEQANRGARAVRSVGLYTGELNLDAASQMPHHGAQEQGEKIPTQRGAVRGQKRGVGPALLGVAI